MWLMPIVNGLMWGSFTFYPQRFVSVIDVESIIIDEMCNKYFLTLYSVIHFYLDMIMRYLRNTRSEFLVNHASSTKNIIFLYVVLCFYCF